MTRKIPLFGLLAGLIGAGANLVWAQVPPSVTAPAHLLQPGDQVFDSDGRLVGILARIQPDGSLVVRETDALTPAAKVAGGGTAVLRVLPAGSLHWTGKRFMANLTLSAIKALPTSS